MREEELLINDMAEPREILIPGIGLHAIKEKQKQKEEQ